MKSWIKAAVAVLSLSVASFTSSAIAQTPPAADAGKGAVTGTVNITFNTRTNLDTSGDLKKDSPAIGAKDSYKLDLVINKFVNFTGEIQRQPNLYSSVLSRRKQEAQLYYNVVVGVVNPKNAAQKKTVGKWVGTVPIDTASGAYLFDGGAKAESPNRFDIDTVGSVSAFKDNFAGKLVGKAEKKETLASYTFKRVVGGKTVSITVKKSDPLRFENLQLAKGPVGSYPRTTVNGTLNYDYETGNYFADNIQVAYIADGKDTTDVISGSIKWVEDAAYKTNGKGRYEFNLRWNEEKNKKPQTEGDAFAKMSEEDAFFTVDSSVPSLTGTVDYVDTFASDGGDEPTVTSSKVTYNLDANALTKQQVMSFMKLWIAAIGPTNDD